MAGTDDDNTTRRGGKRKFATPPRLPGDWTKHALAKSDLAKHLPADFAQRLKSLVPPDTVRALQRFARQNSPEVREAIAAIQEIRQRIARLQAELREYEEWLEAQGMDRKLWDSTPVRRRKALPAWIPPITLAEEAQQELPPAAEDAPVSKDDARLESPSQPAAQWTDNDRKIMAVAKELFPPDGNSPPDLKPASLMHAIENLHKTKEMAGAKKAELGNPPDWSACDRFLKKWRANT